MQLQKIKKMLHKHALGLLLLGMFALVPLFLPHTTLALDVKGTGLVESGGAIFKNLQLSALVGLIIQGILGVLGIVFLALVIYGGMLWMTSEGDEKKVSKARGFLFHSTIGLGIVFSAYVVTQLVLGILTSTTK